MLHKRVTLFGRSVPLTVVFLAVAVVAVGAWAVWLGFQTLAQANVSYADPPEEIYTVVDQHDCVVLSGAGSAGTPSYDPVTRTIACDFSDVDDTSSFRINFNLNNSASPIDVLYTPVLPVTTCFDVAADPTAPKTLLAGEPTEIGYVRFDGNSETVSCAMVAAGSPESFEFQILLDPQ